MTSLPPEAVSSLRKRVWGDVLLPGDDADWASATSSWNLPLHPIKPAIIVRARGTLDIREALQFAKEHGLEVAVKGGGHSLAHLCFVEGGLVIDLCHMRGVVVDPEAKTVTAEGGALLGDIDRATAAFGLAVPLGHAPVTGMGLALGGGVGVLTHIFGPTAKHIVAATVVLADGSIVNVTQSTDPELLWGLRGGGAALGVAASLTFRLHDVSAAYTGSLMIPDDKPDHANMRAVAKFMVETGSKEPLFSNMLVRVVPPDGTPLLILMVVHLGPQSEDEKAAFIQPLRALGPVLDTVGKWRYVDTQFTIMDSVRATPPHYEYATSGVIGADKVSAEFVDEFVRMVDSVPVARMPLTLILFDCWKVPGSQPDGDEASFGPSALATRSCEFAWYLDMGFLDASVMEEAKGLAAQARSTLGKFGGEEDAYGNMSALGERLADARLAVRAGGVANLERLRALKGRVDPGNTFKSHQFKGLVV